MPKLSAFVNVTLAASVLILFVLFVVIHHESSENRKEQKAVSVETFSVVQEAIEGPTVHVGGREFHTPDFLVHTWYFRDDNQGLCFAVSDPPGPGYVVFQVSCDRMRWQ